MNHVHFGPNLVFWGPALGHFSKCVDFFKVLRHRSTMVFDIFTQSPHHKEAFYGTVRYFLSTFCLSALYYFVWLKVDASGILFLNYLLSHLEF